ncbi:MAG: superoxide dismutase, Ni [Parcubacteria group bacterium Gr01-1014_66]|nr:MAG: superoxide dismutase, Ni [Parcubacteria group bacterium Gr01-1014_66]
MHIIHHVLSSILPHVSAEAHCDIPCGVYDPTQAKMAAKTVERMVLQLVELKLPENMGEMQVQNAYHNSVVRRILVKEQHAELCKRELLILWSDFFKAEHLEKFPHLHDLFWNAVKLCSKNKQEVSVDAVRELVTGVDEIAEIFYRTKNAPEKYDAYKKITDTLF